MNTSVHLQILCALLLAFQVFCNQSDKRIYRRSTNNRGAISSDDFFKFLWRSSRHRRSVSSVADGQLKTADLVQTPLDKPQHECGDRVLVVILKHADVRNIFIYGPLGDLLHLGLLASYCGVSIKTTDTDSRLLFNYDSCYVKREATQNVLSMKWYGTDIKLSCPVSVTPPSVTCKGNAMELTVVDGTAEELFVTLNGKVAPLLFVATKCWRRELSKQGELTYSVPYTGCGVHFRDDRFIVDLRSKDRLMPLSCPYVPVLPVKNSEFPVTSRPLPQKQQGVDKQRGQNTAGTPRARWLPNLPSLPGSFNLSVNFPFSVSMPKQPERHREHWFSNYVAPTPSTPEPAPTSPVSTVSGVTEDLDASDETYELTEQELVFPVTVSPYLYMQRPYFPQKPTSTSSQTGPSPALPYPLSWAPLPNTAIYQPFESAQSYNFARQNANNVNDVLANLAQYLPPGYSICPIQNPQSPALPQVLQPAVSRPAQPLLNQKPDITLYNPAVPPIKGYSEGQLVTQRFQPSQYQPYLYQSSSGRPGSTLSLFPTNLQSQTSPLTPSNPLQDAKPFQSPYYRKPSQPSGSVQQPWSTGPLPVKVVPQESRLPASYIPEYLYYQTGGQQSLDPNQRSVVQTPGTGLASQSPYYPIQFSKNPYPPMRPEALSVQVSADMLENTGSNIKGSFQPWSLAQVPRSKAPSIRSYRPAKPAVFPFLGNQGAQLPYSQGPSIAYVRNPVHPERQSEPNRYTDSE